MRKALIVLLCLMMPVCALGESFTIAPYSPDVLEVLSNRHTQTDDEGTVEPFLDTQGFEQVAQSGSARLYLNREYHTLRLEDKRSGYIWGAIPLTDARSLNASWKSYAASIVAIECFDQKNNERRYGMVDESVNTVYTMTDNGFICEVDFSALGISLSVRVGLEDNRLTFRVEERSIRESGGYRLKSLAFMPFMGSVYEDEMKGWFLLPDGPGALMRFQKSASYVAGYDKRIYGSDLAVSASMDAQSLNSFRPDDYIRQDSQVLLPVYGIAHGVGQNGLLGVVEDGALYASVAATPAGLGNMKYNSIMARFDLRQKYNMAVNQSGAGAAVPQEKMNILSPQLAIHLLSGEEADYDRMAVYYRDLLELSREAPASPGLRIEALGREFKDSYLPGAMQTLTTLREAREIALALRQDGIGRTVFVLSRFTGKNKAGAKLSIGSMQELSELRDTVEQGGGDFYLWLDPVRAHEDQINRRLQAANGMNLSPIRLTRSNWTLLYPDTYFFRPELVRRQAEEAAGRYDGYAFAADQLASRLYGDYSTGQENDRVQSALIFDQVLEAIPAPALYTPNQPAWDRTGAFLDLPLVSSQYLYETDTVPFLPIILSGAMEMYAQPMNLGSFSRDRMLRMLEYGVYPSFAVTAAQSSLTAQTPLSDYHSTCFEDWRAFIGETWAYMRPAMEMTGGRRILSHELIARGRVKVSFEGGAVVYINYTDHPWDAEAGRVAPHDYRLWKVSE